MQSVEPLVGPARVVDRAGFLDVAGFGLRAGFVDGCDREVVAWVHDPVVAGRQA